MSDNRLRAKQQLRLSMRAKTLSFRYQQLDECPPDRDRNPSCFNGFRATVGSHR